MKHQDPRACIAAATAALRTSVQPLLCPSPESLDRAGSLLRETQSWLETAVCSMRSSSPEVRPGIEPAFSDLTRALGRVSGLLDHAAGFYSGWMRLRNSLAGGYTAEGQPAEVVSGNRLSLEA